MDNRYIGLLRLHSKFIAIISSLAILAVGLYVASLAYYKIDFLDTQTTLIQSEILIQSIENERDTHSLAKSVADLEKELGITKSQNSNLLSAIELERSKITALSGTVGDLDKLSKTDSELLQKYSKVFFLNEHFVPAKRSEILAKYLYNETKGEEINSEVLPFLTDMLDSAEKASVPLYVKSAYRSFNTQTTLKSSYTVSYGEGANRFSADQGYSEHQLGTTVDLITKGLGGQLEGFDNTTAYTWLQNNAYIYGFVMSYPKNNGYYIFEPWHWRFVGKALALRLHNEVKNFYDLDQRVIDQYLLVIFDK